MRMTVLGSSASYATAGHACAGYLVESGGTRVLFDCGNGVIANLSAAMDPTELDAVFITHGHPDHFCDLYVLESALRYAPEGSAPAVPLWTPAGLLERMKCLLAEKSRSEFGEAFVAGELADGVPVRVGEIEVTPVAVEHLAPSFALRAVAPVGGSRSATLAYTADTAAGPWLATVLAEADLALVEATMPERFAGSAAHLTASQAGAFAREAAVQQLVLTHLWPTIDRAAAAAIATATFGTPVAVAEELVTFEVSGKGIS